MKQAVAILVKKTGGDIICTMALVFTDLGIAATTCFTCKFIYLIHRLSLNKFTVKNLLVSTTIFFLYVNTRNGHEHLRTLNVATYAKKFVNCTNQNIISEIFYICTKVVD